MSAYRGHLTTVVGDGPDVVMKLNGQWVRVLTPDGRVHSWPSEDVHVTGISGNRFWIAFEGEIAVFTPDEPEAFMLEFLPGLTAARTVAAAIEATGVEDRTDGVVSDALDLRTSSGFNDDTSPRPHVVARKAHLPQLADHVAARTSSSRQRKGQIPLSNDAETPDRDESTMRPIRASAISMRWRSRSERPDRTVDAVDVSPPKETANEDVGDDLDHVADQITVDLSAEKADVQAWTRNDPSEADESKGSSLLRGLADRHQTFESEHRGSYKPRR